MTPSFAALHVCEHWGVKEAFYVQQHRDPPKNRGTGQTLTLNRTRIALTMQPCVLSQDDLIPIHTTAQKQFAHQREVGGGRWGNDPLMGFTRSAWQDNSHDDQMGQHSHSRCSSSPFNFIPCAHWGIVGDTPGTLYHRTIPIHTQDHNHTHSGQFVKSLMCMTLERERRSKYPERSGTAMLINHW